MHLGWGRADRHEGRYRDPPIFGVVCALPDGTFYHCDFNGGRNCIFYFQPGGGRFDVFPDGETLPLEQVGGPVARPGLADIAADPAPAVAADAPATALVSEPIAESVAAPIAEPIAAPVAETGEESIAAPAESGKEPVVAPVADAGTAPVAEVVDEPGEAPAEESVVEPVVADEATPGEAQP